MRSYMAEKADAGMLEKAEAVTVKADAGMADDDEVLKLFSMGSERGHART